MAVCPEIRNRGHLRTTQLSLSEKANRYLCLQDSLGLSMTVLWPEG